MLETLLFSVEKNVATITFNRPQAMNSFNDQMADELAELTEQIELDSNIRAVVLNGAGSLFMAGGDIQFFAQSLDTMPKGIRKIIRMLNGTIVNLMRMPKPVLASVQGSVAGVGMSFMMACDLAIAAEDTKFTMAYTKLGITPDGGATFNLPRIVGNKKAMQWTLLSELFDAKTALDVGLINWMVPASKLKEETVHLANKLAQGPTQSFAQTKKLLNKTWHNSLESQLEREAKSFVRCSTTADFKKGVKSFLQKQKPEFIGG